MYQEDLKKYIVDLARITVVDLRILNWKREKQILYLNDWIFKIKNDALWWRAKCNKEKIVQWKKDCYTYNKTIDLYHFEIVRMI